MDSTDFRKERIEKLLYELQYEVTRGMMERELDESLSYTFIVPTSTSFPHGVVYCEFRTRPMPSHYALSSDGAESTLKVVK